MLKNLMSRPYRHPVRSFIFSHTGDHTIKDADGKSITVPRQAACWVNDEEVEITNRMRVEKLVSLSADPKPQCEIVIVGEELLNESDRNFYIQTTLVEDMQVEIQNALAHEIDITEVSFAHPSPEEFVKGRDGIYRYSGAVLPGQGFYLTWAKRTTASAGVRSLPA